MILSVKNSVPVKNEQICHFGPDFETDFLKVSCNILETTREIIDFDAVFEPRDP